MSKQKMNKRKRSHKSEGSEEIWKENNSMAFRNIEALPQVTINRGIDEDEGSISRGERDLKRKTTRDLRSTCASPHRRAVPVGAEEAALAAPRSTTT
uniref:Uncharacterized protein n=1 Tax=Oryza glumipatula TaxID=40148 RepID=A0A0D9ZQI1_9ORYZ